MVVCKGALAALLWAWALAGAAAQVPCSVANEVAPGQVRRFHFQRAGSAQDLLCVFTFQTQLGAPLAVVLHFLRFDNMTERDCECGELNMYDVLPSGEPVLSVRRCAGEAADADGAALVASSSVALLTLSTHACPAPAFALSVGTPGALDVAPGDQHDSTTTTEATTATRPPPSAPTRAPTRRPATTTTTTARPTRRSRPLHTTSTTTTTTTTTEKSGHWWSG